MPAASFLVVFTEPAETDLYDIEEYWRERGEPWRGEKYFSDLRHFATAELGNVETARHGRPHKSRRHRQARSILAFGTYRIIYEIDEAAARVDILRFWHAHRDATPLE